ncbi:MAG: Rpp14/Pop5 family protein [Candidatus Thermoplasmatota archaeon]
MKEGRRRRYIGFKVECIDENRNSLDKGDIIYIVRKRCSELFGEHCKKMGLYIVRFNGEEGILRCRHIEKENSIKLLQSIKEIKGREVKVKTLGTSGTIKSLIKKHMNSL